MFCKIKKTLCGSAVVFGIFAAFIFPYLAIAAAIITENETVANASASTIPSITFANGAAAVNGTIPAITLAGGVTEVKATRTLSVTALALASETVVVGTCTITFQDGGEDIFDETDCSDNAAIINRADEFGTLRSNAQFAAAIRTLGAVSDTGHGGLTVSGSGTSVIFTTTGTETSATAITFTDNASGIASSSSTTGVIPVAATVTIAITSALAASASDASVQIDSLTAISLGSSALTAANVAGAIRTGLTGAAGYAAKDYTVSGSGANIIFTRESTGSSGNGSLTINDDTYTSTNAVAATASATVPAALPASAADQSVTIDGVAISLGASALTATQVAAAIAGATFTSGTSYVANGAYTVSNTGADLTFTRSTGGTGGNNGLTVADASYGGAAQTVTFTPSSFDGTNYIYSITLNGTAYTFTSDSTSVQTIVEGLAAAAAGDAAVSCTEDNAILTCVADSAGTAFTYSSSVNGVPSTQSVIISSGSAGWKRKAILSAQTPVFANQTSSPGSVSSVGFFNKSLEFGFVDDAVNRDVHRLQEWLSLYPTIYPEGFVTGFFGPLTKQAVIKFQLTYDIIESEDEDGAGVFGPITRALANSFVLLRR